MSLLVSKRLGINVPPNITLVNVSPEPREMDIVQYERSRLRKQGMKPPPPLWLPQRRRSKHTRIDNTSSRTITPGSPIKEDITEDTASSTASPPARRHLRRLKQLRRNSQISEISNDSNDHIDTEIMDTANSSEENPAIIDNRRYKRNRSCSVQIRSETQNVRKVVDIIANSFRKKRDVHINKIKGVDEREAREKETQARTRKISVEWFAKSINKKRRSPSPEQEQVESGFQKFRRAARKIKNLIQVCQVCKSITLDQVSGEDWFSKMESIIDSNNEMLSKPQGPSHTRPFITFVQDKESKQLVQLTFDKSLYTRERRADYLLTDAIRTLLKTPANERTMDEENEMLMFMKRAAPSFNDYALEAQRKLLRCMHYDKYEKDRVITRKSLMADGVYFILSGTLVEQTDDKKSLREMKPGERFGDEDIVCGCPRRATIITHSDVEMMSIHRLDYRTIVHMADDSNDPRYLDICKEDIVFRHFPMRKLIENPGVWTVLSYKYGRLMVKDSNDIEWIYIIKSGEAKIIKHLKTGKIDLALRRKKVQKKIDEGDPHTIQKKMINFVSERDYLKSQYKPGEYQPKMSPKYNRYTQSAPSGESIGTLSPKDNISVASPESTRPSTSCRIPSKSKGPSGRSTSIKMSIPDDDLAQTPIPTIEVDPGTSRLEEQDSNVVDGNDNRNQGESSIEDETDLNNTVSEIQSPRSPRKDNLHITIVDNNETNKTTNSKHSAYISTAAIKEDLKLPSIPLLRKGSRSSIRHDEKKGKLVTVPPFVQLESLHAGKVFGLRSILDPNERGPSASLISGGCEVLQINKKFFMKHIDDAILSLIKVQYKAFPTEEDLIDRLDNNFQWKEYKQNTVIDFLARKGRVSSDDAYSAEINIS